MNDTWANTNVHWYTRTAEGTELWHVLLLNMWPIWPVPMSKLNMGKYCSTLFLFQPLMSSTHISGAGNWIVDLSVYLVVCCFLPASPKILCSLSVCLCMPSLIFREHESFPYAIRSAPSHFRFRILCENHLADFLETSTLSQHTDDDDKWYYQTFIDILNNIFDLW